MIANPLVPAFRYDPYTKRLTRELYDHEEMRTMRGNAVAQAKESLVENARKEDEKDKEAWAVVLGTLGRQGNLRVLKVRNFCALLFLPFPQGLKSLASLFSP